ncbi:MAG: hypothetical protein K5856_03660 [Bacteroidaceae bacterium]|nr:hypothetical protein [Bacteroidaceae bacterium]
MKKLYCILAASIMVTFSCTEENDIITNNSTTSYSSSSDESNDDENDDENETENDNGNETYTEEVAYTHSSGTNTVSNINFTSTESDENAVMVSGGTFTMNECMINKSGGDTNDNDGSSFYGTNAAILSTNDGVVNMNGGTISTNAKGANGVVAYMGTVNINDVTIECVKSVSRGIHATGGGTITANNLTIITNSETSSTIATDRGGGTIKVNGGTYTAKGSKSSVIYSTGNISVDGITGLSEKGPIATVEGNNNVIIENSDMTSNAEARGILLHQSNSGDADGTTPICNITKSTLTVNNANAPLCFVTNVAGTLKLTDVTLNLASNILMSVEYYKRGNNSTGNIILLTNQNSWTYTGDVYADDVNNATVTVGENVIWKGAINKENIAKSASAVINGTWTLTADSYVDEISISSSGVINSNGYKLTYSKITNNGTIN